MAQCTLLDSMVSRLNGQQFRDFETAVGDLHRWWSRLVDVSSMRGTYYFDPIYDAAGAMISVYSNDPWGCLHYSRNYFKHAALELQIEKIEAAFCANVRDFLARLLQDIAIKFQGPPTFDVVTLLGNHVEDNDRGNHVAGNMGNQN